MFPRKKEQRKSPETATPPIVTPPIEDECDSCSEVVDSQCPKSNVSEDSENAPC